MAKMPTIYDVAREARVAPSTVSRAFTRPGRISPKTVEAVMAVAQRLGYQPNKSARGLSTGRTGNLAMVIPDIGNAFFTDFMRAFHNTAMELGYSVFLIDTDGATDLETYRLCSLTTQIDGVALVSPRVSDAELHQLIADGTYVVVNRKARGVPVVRIDSQNALGDAVEDLERLGHRNIVYVRGPVGGYSDKVRRRTARALCRHRGLNLFMTEARPDNAASSAAAVGLVSRVQATAALVHSDAAAIALVTRCRGAGIDVPGDLSVIGHDNISFGATIYPPLSTIDAKTSQAGRLAAQALAEWIDIPPHERRFALKDEEIVHAAYLRRQSAVIARTASRPKSP